MKKCSKCGVEKDESEFGRDKTRKDGRGYRCKACVKANSSKYYKENSERLKERKSEYRKENSERLKEYTSKYRKENSEKIKEQRSKYRKENSEKIKERHSKYRKENSERLKEYTSKYASNRLKTDTMFAFIRRIRILTYSAFRRGNFTKRSRTFELVGCSMEDLLIGWGVASIPLGYHIDHIVPLSQAKTVEEVEKLCNRRNLQLLSANDNLSKSDSKTEHNATLCLDLLGREWVD